jgi:hypothetical protein
MGVMKCNTHLSALSANAVKTIASVGKTRVMSCDYLLQPLRGIEVNALNETVRIGRHTLRNRLVMAPMTRSHEEDTHGG